MFKLIHVDTQLRLGTHLGMSPHSYNVDMLNSNKLNLWTLLSDDHFRIPSVM